MGEDIRIAVPTESRCVGNENTAEDERCTLVERVYVESRTNSDQCSRPFNIASATTKSSG